MRITLEKQKITQSLSFVVDSLGIKSVQSKAINNKRGDLIKYTFFDEDGNIKVANRYTYDNKNRIIKSETSSDNINWENEFKNIYEDSKGIETNLEYSQNKIISRTVYFNDSIGRNQSNRFYKDSVLLYLHKFYWSGNCGPDSIVRFDKDSNRLEQRLINTFENGFLTSTIKYEGEKVIQKEEFNYTNNLQIRVIFEIPNDYRHTTIINHRNNLPHKEKLIYESLSDDFFNETSIIWEYN